VHLGKSLKHFEGKAKFELAWHAFELNRHMPAEGQNGTEHVMQKYGSSPEQSRKNRERLIQTAEGLGLEFNYGDDMRIWNTFDAHRLLHWAGETGGQTKLKLALFKAFFSDNLNVSDHEVLTSVVASVGLDEGRCAEILASDEYAAEVRAVEAQWEDRFISGVPAFIFNGKFMVPGAQEPDVFAQIIENKLLPQAA